MLPLLTLFFALPAGAAPLDLQTATELAAERALDGSSAALTLQRQQISQRAANLAWTPTASLNAGAQGSLGRTFSEQVGANITVPVASLSTSLTASMPLYQGGELRTRRQLAEAAVDVSEDDQRQVLHDLRWTVADGLLQIDQARAAVVVQQNALTADQALLRQVELQVTAGSRTPADRHTQESVVASRRANVASAERALAQAELTLLALLRLDPQDAWTFVPPPTLPEVAPTGALIATAMDLRPDLRAAQDQLRVARASKRVAQSSYLPSVSLGAGASTAWISSNSDLFYEQLGNQSRAWGSLDLRLPLLDGGVRRAQVDTAAVAIQEAELAQSRLTDQVTLQVRLLLADELAARSGLEASTTAAQASQRASEVLTLRYETGAESLVSVTNARAALVDAQLDLASAQTALQRVRYQLAWTTGELGAA